MFLTVSMTYMATAITTEKMQRDSSPHTAQEIFTKPTPKAAEAPVEGEPSNTQRPIFM